MRLWNLFTRGSRKAEARFRILRQELKELRGQVTKLQESIDHLIARADASPVTYEHARDGLRLVPRSSNFAVGYNDTVAQEGKGK